MDLSSGVIITYFALTLLVSFLCRRRETALQRILAAPQELGVAFMVPLIFSGLFGGSTVTGTVSSAFSGGLSASLYLLGTAAGCLVFVAAVSRFYRAMSVMKRSYSIPDAFGQRFDQRTRLLMVLVIVVTNALALSTIPLSTATIISNITGTDYEATVWICCAMIIVMALASGLKGVAAMNIIHTVVMFLGLIVLLVPSLGAVGGLPALRQALPASYFSLGSQGAFSFAAVLLGAILAIITSPLAFMTVVSSHSARSAKASISLCALLILPFAACLVLIGLCCKVLAPDHAANAVLYDTALSFGPVCYTFISMSVLASTFSTAPASMLSIITTLNNDIFLRVLKKDATERQQKLFVNLGVVVLTIALMLLGKNASSILGQLTGATQIKSVASLILLISLRWKRVDSRGAFWALLSGSVLSMGWHILGNPFGVQPFWPAVAVTLAVLAAVTLAASREPASREYRDYAAVMEAYEALPEQQR